MLMTAWLILSDFTSKHKKKSSDHACWSDSYRKWIRKKTKLTSSLRGVRIKGRWIGMITGNAKEVKGYRWKWKSVSALMLNWPSSAAKHQPKQLRFCIPNQTKSCKITFIFKCTMEGNSEFIQHWNGSVARHWWTYGWVYVFKSVSAASLVQSIKNLG